MTAQGFTSVHETLTLVERSPGPKDGKPHGRPQTAAKLIPEMKRLRKEGLSKRAIAKELKVSRTSVIRLLRTKNAKAYAK